MRAPLLLEQIPISSNAKFRITPTAVRQILGGICLVLFVLAFVVYIAARLIGFDMVNPRLYTGALSKQHVYNRIYTEVLADPELEDRLISLFGDLGITSSTVQTASSFTVATLRALLPPEVLEEGSERLLVELTAYLKGNRERIKARLDLAAIIFSEELQDRIITEVQTIVVELIAQTTLFNQVVFSTYFAETTSTTDEAIDQLVLDLEAFAYSLSTGQLSELPGGISIVPLENLSVDQKQALSDALLAPIQDTISPRARLQIETALAENHLADALVMASGELVKPHVARVVKRLRQELDTATMDTLVSYASVAERPLEQVIARINQTRDVVGFARTKLNILFAFVMAVAFTVFVRLVSSSPLDMLRLAGISLLLATAVACAAWFVFMLAAGETIPVSISTLPPSVRSLVVDMHQQVFENLQGTLLGRMLYPAGMGLLLLTVAALPRFAQLASRAASVTMQRPVWMVGTVLVLVALPVGFEFIFTPFRNTGEALMKCNGHEVLCSRSIDEITFAAAHNAMSISGNGWIWPNQDGSLTEQLNAGVRAFLIDTYYWHGAEQLEDYLEDLPESEQVAIQETINKMRPTLYREGTYVCHRTCMLGGTALVDILREMRHFLDENPSEVIVLIIQDAITEDDTLQAFQESGLSAYLYRYDPDEDWLTLGEMIEQDARVVVMAEEGGSMSGWYLHLWDFAEETPYIFSSPADFSCQPNRGGTSDDKSLFLLNHWIDQTSPSRVDAARVNQYDALMSRIRSCAIERGRIPNFIAVDFYNIGDLLVVVDALNTYEF